MVAPQGSPALFDAWHRGFSGLLTALTLDRSADAQSAGWHASPLENWQRAYASVRIRLLARLDRRLELGAGLSGQSVSEEVRYPCSGGFGLIATPAHCRPPRPPTRRYSPPP